MRKSRELEDGNVKVFRYRLFMCLILALVIIGIVFAAFPGRLIYLSHRFAVAKTPDEERAAFILVRDWTLHPWEGYTDTYFSEDGKPIPCFLVSTDPNKFDKIRYVQIEWIWGIRSKRPLLDVRNIGALDYW